MIVIPIRRSMGMLEIEREESHQDRLGRSYTHKVFIFICDTCGTRFERRGSIARFLSRKTHACSDECKSISHKQGGVVEKIRSKTCIEKYGVKNPFSSETCKKKIQESMIKNHGVEHPLQSQALLEKAKSTTRKRFGVDYASKSTEVKNKIRSTMMKNHGVEYPMQMQSVQEALEKGCFEKHGVKRVFQNRQLFESIMLECVGVTHPQKNAEIQAKTKKTNLERYGAENVSKSDYFANLEFKNKNCKTGYANFRGRDIWFRSSYEESFINRLDADPTVVDIKCNIATKYEFEGKTRTYFIDFGVEFDNGRKVLFEVKSEYMKNAAKNLAKFASVHSQLNKLHYDDFIVITEKDLYSIERTK